MGRTKIASEACNCSAPDTGNMEVLHQFGSAEQKERWLMPLLEGEIRSAFAMTEPDVASSDATNIGLRITADGDEYVLNGRKWWTTNAMHPNLRILIVMGKTDPEAPTYGQQSMVLVPVDTPGVTIERSLPVFGYHDTEGHGELQFTDVRVPGGEHHRRRGAGVHDRPGPARPGPDPPLHAGDRRGGARARADVRARRRAARRSAARSRTTRTSGTGSPSRGSSSRWRACW